MFGPQFNPSFCSSSLAIAAWNLPSYRSGNPGSTFICTLWRRAKHKFTPQVVKDIWASDQFQNRLELWTIIHALGSNTKARFEKTKMLQSSSGGLPLCYALRRLSNNIQEPYRTLSLQAIDASINWWKGKPAPRASALRAPWSLSPDLQKSLKTLSLPMAPSSLGSPGPLPCPIIQDHLCQTCLGFGPTLQPQTFCYDVVYQHRRRVLLQELASVQEGIPQSE